MVDGCASLRDVRYAGRAYDLARFRDEPADKVVAAFVDAVRVMPSEERENVRSAMTEPESYTILQFARRQAASALRESRPDLAVRAVEALTLVDRDKIDYRDLSVDFPLFAARSLGRRADDLIDMASGASAPGTADTFRSLRERLGRLSLADCGLIQVSSAWGVGFMEGWTRSYDPATGLAEAAISLADAIDSESSYVTSGLRVSDLPEVWFSTSWATGKLSARGCVTINADHVTSEHPYSHGLMVFVAQFADAREAWALMKRTSEASTKDRPRAASSSAARLALFVGGSTTKGEDALESAPSLNRFCHIADSLL